MIGRTYPLPQCLETLTSRVKKASTRIAGNTILVFFSLVTTLAVLEAYFRYFDPQSLRLSRPDAVLGWKHIPDTTGSWRKGCFSAELRFNSEGMRDIEHPLRKPEGTYRIAVIGDSYVTSHEVALDETLFRQLQLVLNGQGYNVEALGFGVRGFGTDQEYLLLENYALRYDPDLVILVFVPNDVRNNLLALERNPAKPYFEVLADGSVAQRRFTPMPDHSGSWKSMLFENLHSLRFVYFRAADIPAIHNALVRYGIYANVIPEPAGAEDLGSNTVYRASPWPPEWEESWRVTTALLRAMNKKSADRGAKFILFSVTSAIQVDDTARDELAKRHPDIALEYDNLNKRLAAFSLSAGIDYVSSLSAMRELQAGGRSVHLSCDTHWSGAAYNRAAGLLAEYLISRKLVQTRDRSLHPAVP